MSDRANSDHKASEKSFFARTAKNTSKRAKRAQEKVKRKLGKTDETKDEIFDRFVENFNNQQEAIQRLEKELKNYINCVKAMKNANQLFGEAVQEVYEPEWSEREIFVNLLDSIDVHWSNLIEKLQDEVLDPLTSYQMQFPDTKNRISKRNRKLVDYDRHRHHVETLKVKGGKAADPKKLSQAEDEHNQAKSVYLQLHSDLYDELPALYDSRIPFYVSSFQSIFTAEGIFHRETAKIETQMSDMLDVLAKETSDGAYSTRRPLSVISNASSDGENSPFEQTDNFTKLDNTDNSDNGQSENEEDTAATDLGLPSDSDITADVKERGSGHSSPQLQPKRPTPAPPLRPPPVVNDKTVERPPSPQLPVTSENEGEQTSAKTGSESATDTVKVETENAPPDDAPLENVPSENAPLENRALENATEENATLESEPLENAPEDLNHDSEQEKSSEEEKAFESDLESRILYKIICTHPYNGEDEDELTFEKGDIIQVVMYGESDDPDDGWLLGISQRTGLKGVFPENFTKRLSEVDS